MSSVGPSPDDIVAAAEVLRAGGLVVFPTETVYGIGADARDDAAVRRVFEVKGRPAGRALTVHIGPGEDPAGWAAEVPSSARRLMETHWPGPLTVILPSRPDVSAVVRGGGPTVGLRMPDHPTFLALAQAFGGGIAATSANRHGSPSPVTAAEAEAQLGPVVDAVLDGGVCSIGVDSTVVDCTVDPPAVLRQGAIPLAVIQATLGLGL
jgi:L-threonylcarbamoyladenylate synthase